MMLLGEVLSWTPGVISHPLVVCSSWKPGLCVRNLLFRSEPVVSDPHTSLMNSEKPAYLCWVTEERMELNFWEVIEQPERGFQVC